MMVFWLNGYDATTTRMLEEATGVGIRSLANAFGDKDAIFERALDRYFKMVQGTVDAVFEAPGLGAIEMVFQGFLVEEPPESIRNAGCLMVNTVFELSKTSEAVRDKIEAYRAMWLGAFRRSLVADGVVEPDERAEFLTGILWGALSQVRLARQNSAGAAIARVAIETIQTWR